MKKIIGLFFAVLFSAGLYAQEGVIKFLGIPVDGTKQEMIQKLKSKGFTYDQREDDLQGEFNGEEVLIQVQTQNNKVWRLFIMDTEFRTKEQIKIRFNKLVGQFENNGKYIPVKESQTIDENEDIDYEISLHDKQYEAVFYLKAAESKYSSFNSEVADSVMKEQYPKELKRIEEYKAKFSETQWENPTKEMQENLKEIEDWRLKIHAKVLAEFLCSISGKNMFANVWFTIGKIGGRYRIVMFYENLYNKADGSDL